MRSLDHSVFFLINRWPDSLDPFFLFLSEGNKWLGVRIFLVGLFSYYVWNKKTRTPALLILVAVPLANELTDILKAWLQVPRPCVELADQVNLRVKLLTSFGTASAHSANMAAVATLFTLGCGIRWGAVWIFVAIFTGISRIYVGVHYPSQVLFGWGCGIAVSSACWYGWQNFQQRRATRLEELPEAP